MKTILVIAMGLAASAAFATPECKSVRPFFYQVEKDGKTSYLMGTMHAGIDLSAYPDTIMNAFKKSKAVMFEADNKDFNAEFGPKLQEDAKYPAGQSLKDVLSPTAMSKLQSIFGQDTEQIAQLKPWALDSVLMESVSASMTKQDGVDWMRNDGLDATLLQKAKDSGKRIEFADKKDDLLALAESVGTPKDLECLLSFPDPMQKFVDSLRSARATYCGGNEETMHHLMESDDCEGTKGEEPILEGRTKAWLPHIKGLYKDGDAFVAVGVGHLLGPQGLLALLRQDGFTVSRVEREIQLPAASESQVIPAAAQ